MHSDHILHFLSMTKAPLATFSEDDTTILSKIPSLLLNTRANSLEVLAQRVYDLLTASPDFEALHRVCIAKRMGLSNYLEVLSSMQVASGDNRLGPGYHCFVRPESSLLSLKATDIRIFHDAKEVVQSFLDRHEPAQRSIQRIADSGFRAGIVLPLNVAGRNLGFLFLNSLDVSFARMRSVDYCLFTYLQSLVSLALAPSQLASETYYQLAQLCAADYLGDFFEVSLLQLSLRRHLEALGRPVAWTIDVLQSLPEILISHGHIAHFASRFADALQSDSLQLRLLPITGETLQVQVQCTKIREQTLAVQLLLADCRALKIEATYNEDVLDLRMPCDRAAQQRPFRYSTDLSGTGSRRAN